MIECRDITKIYSKEVLKNLSFSIKENEIICMLGPSGCGKTTLLRLLSGLEKTNGGVIKILNKSVDDGDIFIHPGQRDVGLIFQDFALFPHLTVRENILIACENQKKSYSKINHLINEFDLNEIQDKYPETCSGGQKQRTAIARSIAQGSKILLLDEPFGQIDEHLKFSLRNFLKTYLKKNNITAIFVTHDNQDAFELADRIIVMNNGEIEQFDTPDNLINKPHNTWVAKFLGQYNIFSVKQISNCRFFSEIGEHLLDENEKIDESSKFMVVPFAGIEILDYPTKGSFRAEVLEVTFQGSLKKVIVKVNTKLLTVNTSFYFGIKVGDIVNLKIQKKFFTEK